MNLAAARASEQFAKTAVIACLTSRSPTNNSKLLHKASAAARERDGEFYVALVDLARIRLGREQVRTLIEDTVLARSLGAKIVWFDTSDVISELLQFARKSRIGMIFVSRGQPTVFSGLFRRTVYRDLLRRAKGVRIDVVGLEQGKSL